MIKFCIAHLLLLIGFMASAQHQLTIHVLSAEGKPLANATVTLLSQPAISQQTDVQGKADFLSITPNTYRVQVSHLGHQNKIQRVLVDNDLAITIQLTHKIVETEEVLVEATRAKDNSPTTFKNISNEEIRLNNLGQDIPYLLDQTPSVVVNSDAGAGIGYTSMRIRGSDNARINVTLNGITLNDSESMGSFFVNLPDFLSSTQNMQIQRGVGTSSNGAGSFGASINIQSITLDQEPSAELNNSFGTFNTWKNTFKVGTGLLDNKFAFNARLSQIKSDGYIDRAFSDLKSFYVDAGYYGEKQSLKAVIFSGKEKTYQAWDGVPEDKLETDRTYNVFTYPNQTDNYTQTHHQLHYSYFTSPNTTINTSLHYTRGAGYYEEYKKEQSFSTYNLKEIINNGVKIDSTDLVRRRWLDNHFYGLVFSINHQINPSHSLTIGGAANQYVGDHYGEIIWAQYASNSQLGDKYYFNDAKKNDATLYTKWDGQFGKVNLFGDLQYRFVDYTFEGYDRNKILTDVTVQHHFFNPKAGLTYTLNPSSSLYTSYAIANKEPVRNDYVESAATARPKAEQMHNIEMGYRLRQETLNIGANLYGMFYRNQLILTGEINDVGAVLRENVPNSHRIGVELDGSWKITNKWRWNATASLSQNKIKNYKEYLNVVDENWNDTGDPQVVNKYKSTTISFSPSTILSSNLSYSISNPFTVSLVSKYVSRQYLDNTAATERSIDPFFTNNLRMIYSFSAFGIKNIDANLAINNIFNEKYEGNGYTFSNIDAVSRERIYGNGYYPQATTNFLFGLNIRF